MKITELSVKKPVAIITLTIAAIFLGIMGYINLGSDLMPNVNIPVVSVTTAYPGAGAEEIDKDIVKPIEDVVCGISGVDKVQSTAGEGYANTIILFKLSADANTSFADVQKAVDSIAGKLPKDASKPTLYKFDNNDQPILTFTLSGDKSFEELFSQAEDVKGRIETVEGVGSVTVFGARQKELIIKADKTKLDYYGIGINKIVNTLKSENVNIPGGTIYQSDQDKIVRVQGELNNINDIKKLRIPIGNSFVQLDDVAEISLDYPKTKEITRINGKPAVGINIKKQSDANVVSTGTKVKERIDTIKNSLNGTELKIVADNTLFITSTLKENMRTLIEGVITTALVLFLFLRQWRSVFIVVCSIPTSLIATFFMMYEFGFTLNMLSMMGLSLCVGILVDDSIVVLENIHRHLKMKKDPDVAAIDGRNEIGMAAIAITLSDVVVFAPIAFMSGVVGQYFKQFGLTVVFATLLSLLVSFTLTPMLASKLFKKEEKEKHKESNSIFDRIGKKIITTYQNTLLWSLNNRFKVISIIVVLIVISGALIPLKLIGTEFMPSVDEGNFTVDISLTQGASIEKTNEKVKVIENFIKDVPELEYYYSYIGSGNAANEASVSARLVNKKDRKRTTKEVVEFIRKWGKTNLTGVDFTVNDQQSAGGRGTTKPIQVNVKGSKMDVIQNLSGQIEKIITDIPGTVDVGNSLKSGNPEIDISVNRLALANFGFSVIDISNAVRSSIEGSTAGVFRKDGEDYDIRVNLQDNQIKEVQNIENLSVQNNAGQSIPLSQISTINMGEGPTTIKKIDKQRVVTVSANVKEGYASGDISTLIQKSINNMKLPDGYSITFGGEQQMMSDSFTSLIQVLILSLVLVYMILAILYESFLTPFVRILALPVASIGALCMLALTHSNINIMTMIGFIMLDGLAAKNGTLLIDYTNTLMERGASLRDALYEAGSVRLKPIFMTSITMIMGMIPTAMALGDGSEFKSGMAISIIGGMITSTIFSPILLPVAYTLIDDFTKYMKKLISNKKVNHTIENSSI